MNFTWKIGGEAGFGIMTTGLFFSKAISRLGYNILDYVEYPSLIRGGHNAYEVRVSESEVYSFKPVIDLLVCLNEETYLKNKDRLISNSLVVFDSDEFKPDNKYKGIGIPFTKILNELKANIVMKNTFALAVSLALLSAQPDVLNELIREEFQRKGEEVVLYNQKFVSKAYEIIDKSFSKYKLDYLSKNKNIKKLVLTGNDAFTIGSVISDCRIYYAYPMTPITAVFKHIQEYGAVRGVLLKQAENEITAIQMTLGSMYMGTRALVATSGGGFDLMTETISCSGMTETPLVVILGQRAGASTGVPTWSGSSDLNIAIKAGHGEYPKAVLAVSDIESSYTLIQKAFNLAEKYQMPVILLTEKQITESLFTVGKLPNNIHVIRYLSDMSVRYKITDTGISPRRIPTFDKEPFLSNSDEHNEKGESTENSKEIKQMTEKRMRKLKTLEKEFPQPELYNPHKSETIIVGWGSVKNTVLDLIFQGEDIGYLHYEYLYPLKTELLNTLIKRGKKIILIENNQTGQLGEMLKEKTGYPFKKKLLKYDGRPFFVEDILEYLKNEK